MMSGLFASADRAMSRDKLEEVIEKTHHGRVWAGSGSGASLRDKEPNAEPQVCSLLPLWIDERRPMAGSIRVTRLLR